VPAPRSPRPPAAPRAGTPSPRRRSTTRRPGGLLEAPLPAVELHAGPLLGASVGGGAPDVLAVAVRAGSDAGPPVAVPEEAAALQERFGVDVASELARAKAKGAVGEITPVPLRPAEGDGAADTVLLLGTGDGSPLALRQAGAALARRVKGRERLAVAPGPAAGAAGAEGLRAFVEGLLLGSYAVPRRTGSPAGDGPVGAVTVVVPAGRGAAGTGRAGRRAGGSAQEPALRRAVVTGRAVARARDLANTPSDVKDPAWLAARAVELGAAAGLSVRVRDERELAAEGFGGIVAVGSGSVRPPRLVELRYQPETAGRRTRHVVLVGKGITFDSGGLSLKPREAMVPMKTDMAGGGVVIAAMAALRDLDVRARVTGLVAAAENMPGAAAMRPGDVIRHYGGRTVEVFNTDAEGRLVLADALAYADEVLDPDVVVDIATLTGAASLGLGRRHAALYSRDDRLAAELTAAGEASGDRVWRMPLVEDYRPALDSAVADLANVSRDRHVSGGSITAALFLREFAGRRRWAHLDIAGPARADADEHEVSKGGTGFGARLLLRWLEG
jgi:leucyl aminopeptidase